MGFLYDNFISGFFSTVIQWIHNTLTGDYVIAILLVTLLLRLILLPLDIKQKKQMRKMTALQERTDKIKERYANNKEKQQKKIAELYKQEGVSPFSSCLPLLFQMVFLLAFFGAVRALSNYETVAMVAQAAKEGTAVHLPSFLWIKNIWQPDALALVEKTTNILPTPAEFQAIINSTPALKAMLPAGFDPSFLEVARQPYLLSGQGLGFFEQIGVVFRQSNGWFLLPLLAGASAYFQGVYQMKSGMLQQQGKIMKYGLPLFSVYICAISGTAFAIYWTFTNVFSIIQQAALNAYFKKGENGKPGEKRIKLPFSIKRKNTDEPDTKEDA
ncbi:MAG: YidC/Oxa1 family membrane protein insertase [Bacillota bacterium]